MIELVEIRPNTWSIAIPLPIGAPPYTLCYVIAGSDGSLHLIDPGWDHGSNFDDLLAVLPSGPVASVTVTHMHVDHLGLAARVRDAFGAVVGMHRLEQRELDLLSSQGPELPNLDEWGIPLDERAELSAAVQGSVYPQFTADRLLSDGDLLDIPGRRIRVLHTPGHTVGSICLHDEENGLLLTGDTLLSDIFPGIGLGGRAENPIADYLGSLDRIAGLDALALPGHGHPFATLAERCAETRAHQLTRTAEVERILAEVPDATVWEVARRVTWTDGFENLRRVHLASALAQTAMRMAYR